ncbi:MAG: 1,4-dihydroxy-2-naphthoate octaprenyltransferase [Muribaculaceae bacterium]|nr:1,4-dihydroxy-2-naphthoate octaprenyltransferase [Muribaculaceae bacterium]
MKKKRLKAWVEAIRPRTLPVSVAGVVCAFAYALEGGYSIGWPGWVCLVFALLCQTASNFANEYFDYRAGRDTPGREGPRRGVTEGDISPRAMIAATCVVLALACGLGLSLILRGGWWMIAVGAAVVAGVYAYSAGPWPLSTHGLGEAAVVVFFGLVPVCLTYYLLTLSMRPEVVAAACGMGLLGANVLVVNNFRDIPDDEAVGKRTLAVRFGRKAMVWLYRINVVVATACLLPGFEYSLGIWNGFAGGIMVAVGLGYAEIISKLEGHRLNKWLGRTAMFMVLVSMGLLISALAG